MLGLLLLLEKKTQVRCAKQRWFLVGKDKGKKQKKPYTDSRLKHDELLKKTAQQTSKKKRLNELVGDLRIGVSQAKTCITAV